MFILALFFYFLDFIFWIFLKRWLLQSFFILLLVSWFAEQKEPSINKTSYLWLMLLTIQNTIRYGNFLIALASSLSLWLGFKALQTTFDTTKPFYAYLFLLGFYSCELLLVKKWVLGLTHGGYFTYEAFLVNIVVMSILMGIQGNRASFFRKPLK